MTQQHTKVLKMSYSGIMEYIPCPEDSSYENVIEIAIERFAIPTDFKDFIQISNESRNIFDKESFESYIVLFPDPEIVFNVRVDYSGLLDSLRMERETRKPFSKLNSKRQRSDEVEVEVEAVPVTRQNCFIGSFPGNNPSSEEPRAKRQRNDFIGIRALAAVKRTTSKKFIRI